MERHRTRKIQITLFALMMLSCLVFWYFFERQVNQGNNLIDHSKLSLVRRDSMIPSYNSPCACMGNSSRVNARQRITSVVGKVNLDWCSTESTLRGPNQKVVSFSLFGNADELGMRYYSLLHENAIIINQVLPDWIMRVHHNIPSDTKEHKIMCDAYCENPSMDLCDVRSLWRKLSKRKNNKNPDLRPISGDKIFNLNRRIWRFLPLLDPQVDNVLTRDMDAFISNREISALHQWFESNYTFHVMRDHQEHKAHILAGLFGVKIIQRRDLVSGLTRVLINYGQNQRYDTDQNLLSKIFWPSVKHDVMAHDSYNCMENWNALLTFPFPTKRVNRTFVSGSKRRWKEPKPCPKECRPPDHQEWEYC